MSAAYISFIILNDSDRHINLIILVTQPDMEYSTLLP